MRLLFGPAGPERDGRPSGEWVDLSAMIQGPVRLERAPDPIADIVADLVRRFDPGGYVLHCPLPGCGWELLVPRMELDPTPLDIDVRERSYTLYVEGVPRDAVEDELAGHIDWHASTSETQPAPAPGEDWPEGWLWPDEPWHVSRSGRMRWRNEP